MPEYPKQPDLVDVIRALQLQVDQLALGHGGGGGGGPGGGGPGLVNGILDTGTIDLDVAAGILSAIVKPGSIGPSELTSGAGGAQAGVLFDGGSVAPTVVTVATPADGSIHRSVMHDAYQEWNVRDPEWNGTGGAALGNGIHDDREAIQRCLNACAAAGGGTVCFPEGTYLFGGSVSDVTAGSQVQPTGGSGTLTLSAPAAASGFYVPPSGTGRVAVGEDSPRVMLTFTGISGSQLTGCGGGDGTTPIAVGTKVWQNHSPISVPSGIHLKGEGPGSILLRHKSQSRMIMDGVQPATDIWVEKLTFDGNLAQNDNNASDTNLTRFNSVTRLRVSDCIFRNAGGFQFALTVRSSTDAIVVNNLFSNNRRDGLVLSGANRFVIANNILNNFGTGDLSVNDQGDDNLAIWSSHNGVIVGNTIGPSPLAEGGRGIVLGGCYQITITGNHILGTYKSCINVGHESETRDIVIVGNLIGRTGEYTAAATPDIPDCIHIWSGPVLTADKAFPVRRILIANNEFWNPARHCVNIQTVAAGSGGGTVLVEGVEVKDNSAYVDQYTTLSTPWYGDAFIPPEQNPWSAPWVDDTGRFVSADIAAGEVRDLRIIGNRTEGMPGESIYCKGAGIKRLVVKDHLALDCGVVSPATAKFAYHVESVVGLEFVGNKAVDTRAGAARLTKGGNFAGPVTGKVRIDQNDVSDTVTTTWAWGGAVPAAADRSDLANFPDWTAW